MGDTVRTAAIFDSDAFNLTEPKDYFVNPCCLGDDLARWLLGKLEERGFGIDAEPGQEDFGWHVLYEVDGKAYCATIGGYDVTRWWINVERHLGLLGSLAGGRNRNIPRSAVRPVHDILGAASEIRNLSWYAHADFARGIVDESAGSPSP